MPEGLDELLLAGFLRRDPSARQVRDCDLAVPASSQIVLEGYVEPGERRREGPFGDHTGFYSHADDYPVFHITCVTRRKNPIYLTTVVGIPPMEDFYLGKASERIFLPLIKKTVPEIVDMTFPAEGIFHNIVIISIDKRYPGHARKIMNAVWGLGQLMFSKTVIVVDKDVDVQNLSEVAWIVGTHIDPERDIQFMKGPVDDLEDASDLAAYGSKMGIDATRKWPSEGFKRPWPTSIRTTEAAARRADEVWAKIRRDGRQDGHHLDEASAQAILAEPQLIAVGVRGDEARRARHGAKTTFVRASRSYATPFPPALAAWPGSAGEIASWAGRHPCRRDRDSKGRARALAGATPLTGFSLADLLDMVGGRPPV